MSRKKKEFSPIIHLLELNNTYYELRQNCYKLTLVIPILNIYIDKYYFNSNYYIYVQKKYIKKINKKELDR